MSNGNTRGSGRACMNSLLMVSLSRFYSTSDNIEQILPFVNGDSLVSLRLIDWFVTNYTKNNNVVLTRTIDNNVVHFNVYLSYRAQLKAYSKQQFDPFRRRNRIAYYYKVGTCIETTVGQLNFFRWMIENQVLKYVMDHAPLIEQDMLTGTDVEESDITHHTPPRTTVAFMRAEDKADDANDTVTADAPTHNVRRFKGEMLVAFN